MQDFYTENLADFGYREIKLLRDILDAWVNHGLPDDFGGDEVRPAFNMNSGNVFLVNSDYDVAMLTSEGKLEKWHTLPYGGDEGFLADLLEIDPNELNADDVEYIQNLHPDYASEANHG